MTTENENQETGPGEAKEGELETIQSDPGAPFTLSTGTRIKIARLRTRETMSLLRILTKGAGDVLAQTRFSLDMDPEEFMGIFIGSVMLSVPVAEDETLEFVQRMVLPEFFIDDPRTKPERESNQQMLDALYTEMHNPELDDLLEIVERVVRAEAPHIQALGKRLAAMLALQPKVAAKKTSRKNSKTSSAKSTKG